MNSDERWLRDYAKELLDKLPAGVVAGAWRQAGKVADLQVSPHELTDEQPLFALSVAAQLDTDYRADPIPLAAKQIFDRLLD